MTTGIICEFNPIHLGHVHLFDELRRRGSDTIVCLMSSNFVQRGEPAMIDKYHRAEMAVRDGADLVLELPFPWSCAGARYFAEAGVCMLDALGVPNIAFGSESADAERLMSAARALARNEVEEKNIKPEVGCAEGYFDALENVIGDGAPLSNDILGIEYMRAACILNRDVDFTVIKRIGAGHRDTDIDGNEFPSASALRCALKRGELPRNGLSESSRAFLMSAIERGEAPASSLGIGPAFMARFRLGDECELSAYAECGGGVAGRLCRAARETGDYCEMLSYAATKKYTDARLRRASLFALLGIKRSDISARPTYTTVLASNARGRAFLASIRRSARIKVFTRPADAIASKSDEVRRQAEMTVRAEALYSLALPHPLAAGEFLHQKPVCLQNSD